MSPSDAASGSSERQLIFGLRPGWWLLVAGLCHVLLSLTMYWVAVAQWFPGVSSTDGRWVFVPDSGLDLAARLADDIRRQGWIAVRREYVHWYVGGAYKFYAPGLVLFGSTFYSTVPLTSGLFVLTLWSVYRLGTRFWSVHVGFAAAALIALWPSALLHSTQPVKDAPFIAGQLLFLNAVILSISEDRRRKTLALMAGLSILAFLLASTVRPHVMAINLALWTLGLMVTLARVVRGRRDLFLKCTVAAVLWCVFASQVLTTLGVAPPAFISETWSQAQRFASAAFHFISGPSATPEAERTEPALGGLVDNLPDGPQLAPIGVRRLQGPYPEFVRRLIERGTLALATRRHEWRHTATDSTANIDTAVGFEGVGDVIRYVPRATQIALWAPFPNMWLTEGRRTGRIGRVVAGAEMALMYVLFPLAVFALWHKRRRWEVWAIMGFALLGMVLLSLVVTNLGALFRMRYSYWFAIALMATGGAEHLWRLYHARRDRGREAAARHAAMSDASCVPPVTHSPHVREPGTFTVSIDLEIAWRCCGDRVLTTELREGLRYEAEVVDRILALFSRYDISATWAVVGHLLVDACARDPGGRFHPEIPRPIVFGETRDWFFQHPDAVDADEVGFYGRELVERIRNARPPQEIGSHSFSHIPYAETMSHRAAVEADLRQASSLHAAAALPFASFVFPRNQVGHLDVLAQAGVRSFRGTPRLWYETLPSPARKLFSFASYVFATAPPTFRIRRDPSGLVNIPGSMLLMSRNGVRRLLSTDRLVRRAHRGLRAAVRRGEMFHLWFHPCNFTDCLELMDEQFIVLERILAEAAALRQAGRLDILTMNQQADRLAARESRATAQPESVAFHDERAGLFQDLYARSARQPLTNAFTCGRAHLAERLDAVLRALPPGSRVLDLGCGTGDHLGLFRARGLDVIGVEPSPAMRAIAQAKNADVPILDGIAQSIPLDDASVDFVLAIEVMRYLDEATCLQGYREILRVLKPGGTAFVTLVNRWALDGYTLFYKGQRMLSALGFGPRPVHCEFVTPPQIRRQLVSIGAGSAKTEGCLFAPLRIAYKIHPALGQTMSRWLYKVDSRLANGPLTATAGHLICVFSR